RRVRRSPGRALESVPPRLLVDQQPAGRGLAPHQGGRRRSPRDPGASRLSGGERVEMKRVAGSFSAAGAAVACIGGASARQPPAANPPPPSAQPPATQPPPSQEPPRFRSSVDVTSLDVTVVDDRGKPIDNLKPEDFIVRIEGSQRRVVSAEWVSLVSEAT